MTFVYWWFDLAIAVTGVLSPPPLPPPPLHFTSQCLSTCIYYVVHDIALQPRVTCLSTDWMSRTLFDAVAILLIIVIILTTALTLVKPELLHSLASCSRVTLDQVVTDKQRARWNAKRTSIAVSMKTQALFRESSRVGSGPWME